MTSILVRQTARVAATLFTGITLYSAELGLALTCLRLLANRYDPRPLLRDRLALASDRENSGPTAVEYPMQPLMLFATVSRDDFAL